MSWQISGKINPGKLRHVILLQINIYDEELQNESPHEKTNNLHIQKQRCRPALQ